MKFRIRPDQIFAIFGLNITIGIVIAFLVWIVVPMTLLDFIALVIGWSLVVVFGFVKLAFF